MQTSHLNQTAGTMPRSIPMTDCANDLGLRELDHMSINVANFERAVTWYSAVLGLDAENEKKGAKGKKKGKAQTDDQSIASFNHSGPNDRSAIKVTAKGVKIYGGIGKMAIACISLVHEMGHLASARNTPPKVYTSYEDADFELSWEGAPDGAQTIEVRTIHRNPPRPTYANTHFE